MAVIQPRPTHILYQCAKFGDDRSHLTSFLTCATFNMYKAYTHILVFYFSVISIDIDLKCIQDTYRVVINSPKKNYFDRSKVKVTGMVHCFLKVTSYHKNWAIENV